MKRSKACRGKPARHCATVRERTRTGDPPRLVEVVARLSRRHRRSATGQPNRRVRRHRPNQINIPPIASDSLLQPSSFLLRRNFLLVPSSSSRTCLFVYLSRLPFAPIPASIIDRASLLFFSLFLA